MWDNSSDIKRIVFYGDSNTFGYDPRAFFGGRYPSNIRWTDVLAEKMKDEVEVIPRGMNGRTIPYTPYDLDAFDRMVTGLAPIDYLAIMLGTNDVLLTDNPDYAKAADKMENLIRHAKALREIKDGRCKIILMVPPLLFPGSEVGSVYQVYESQSKLMAEAYRKIIENEDVIGIDCDSWNIDLSYDGVHITEDGSLDFARLLEDELRKMLGI